MRAEAKDTGLRSRGWGPWRQDWYHVCSAHQGFADGCPRCLIGEWQNVWSLHVSQAFYKASPSLWKLWANRPAGKARLAKLIAKIRGTDV
jgi:hypothetical protein